MQCPATFRVPTSGGTYFPTHPPKGDGGRSSSLFLMLSLLPRIDDSSFHTAFHTERMKCILRLTLEAGREVTVRIKKITFHPPHPRWYKSPGYRDNQATPNRRHLICDNTSMMTKERMQKKSTYTVHQTDCYPLYLFAIQLRRQELQTVDLQPELSTTYGYACTNARMFPRMNGMGITRPAI